MGFFCKSFWIKFRSSNKMKKTYIAFLRGINVGGHHKVPMADLRKEMATLGFENIKTILNSGNIIFDGEATDLDILEGKIAERLEAKFGFPIPTVLRSAETITDFLTNNPFEKFELTKETRFYVSFLRNAPVEHLELPWISDDGAFRVIEIREKTIFSMLDLTNSKTPKAMGILEKFYGKDITTRNWNTLKRIEKKMEEG